MRSLHRNTSLAAIAAAAALLGAACASSDRPAGAADGEENGATVEERGQAEEPATNGDRGLHAESNIVPYGGGGCSPLLQDGAYCGGDMVMGSASSLYQCMGGLLSFVEICPHFCQVNSSGTPDRCF